MRLAVRVREQLHGGDIGIGVGHAPGHQRACVGLLLRHPAQPRHEIPQRQHVEQQPAQEGHHQPGVEDAHHRHHGDEIDHHVDQDVGEDEPGIAHRQRRLHHLGGDAAGKFVLVEAHALLEHQAVEIPAQPHREVAEHALVLEQRLRAGQQDAAGQHRGQHGQRAAVFLPQRSGLHRGQRVDHVRHHAEQQRLEGADAGGEQRHQQQVGPHAARVFPQEGDEAARWRRWQGIRVGMHQGFELGEQESSRAAPRGRFVQCRPGGCIAKPAAGAGLSVPDATTHAQRQTP